MAQNANDLFAFVSHVTSVKKNGIHSSVDKQVSCVRSVALHCVFQNASNNTTLRKTTKPCYANKMGTAQMMMAVQNKLVSVFLSSN